MKNANNIYKTNYFYCFKSLQFFLTLKLVFINNTLFTNYHEEYLLAIFNIKKRSFRFNAKNFPLSVLLKLELNDVLQIKDNYYRIDNFTSNLITGDVDFNLVNSFVM